MQMKWAKKQRKFFDYETKNKMRTKTITITALAAGIVLVAFFWSDIKGAAGSYTTGNKKEGMVAGKNKEDKSTEAASPGITIKSTWEMPEVLKEISALSHINGDQFATVQDEAGKIFIYNTQRSALEKEIPFAAPGDYEGLAIVDETAWVLRADGRLFEVTDFNGKPVVKEYKTHLTAEQNAEGLCYDKDNNRLLVAIKDDEPGKPGYKGIYSFDLATKQMPAQPVFKIDMTDDAFSNTGGKKKKGGGIKPSAIAVHPTTGDLYITDGPKAKLLVMTKNGSIKNLYQLDGKEFAQPEGITFTPAGEMYISNEGSKQPGNILHVAITGQ